ncbi:hypothetical protein GCM10020000_83810 [Streptomyces olivoverticillatus]
MPRLADVLHGRIEVACKMDFDRGIIERELRRRAADEWLGRVRWEGAMVPYAVWRGLWSVKRGAYRNQPLGGPHDAVADARLLIAKLEQMAATPFTSPW